MVQQVAFPVCLMHGNKRQERSGQPAVPALEGILPFAGPFSRLFRQEEAGPCRCPVPQSSPAALPVPGAGSAQGGGTRALPASHSAACPGSSRPRSSPNPCAGPGTARHRPRARWHRPGTAPESAPGPTLPSPGTPAPRALLPCSGTAQGEQDASVLWDSPAAWAVRWGLPGCWKYPGCRMAAVVREVVPRLAGAWHGFCAGAGEKLCPGPLSRGCNSFQGAGDPPISALCEQ